MDRQGRLKIGAQALRVSIFCDLPWGYRVAHALTVLASQTTNVFGRILGSVFLQRAVEGMADPGPHWDPSARDPSRTLPTNYYADFGGKVFRIMSGKFRDPSLVEETMVEVMTKFAMHPELVQKGTGRSRAEALVIEATKNTLRNRIKAEQRRPHESLFDTDQDGQERTLDLDDPHAAEKFEDFFNAQDMRGIRRDLAHIMDWAPGYLDMVLEGYDDTEIIGDPVRGKPSLLAQRLHAGNYLMTRTGVPLSLGSWSKPGGYKQKIRDVVNRHIES